MNQNEIADRLEAWFRNPNHGYQAAPMELASILAALRAADEKATRLPEAVKESVGKFNTLEIQYTNRSRHGNPDGNLEYRAHITAGCADDDRTAHGATPEAALDALAAALEKEKA